MNRSDLIATITYWSEHTNMKANQLADSIMKMSQPAVSREEVERCFVGRALPIHSVKNHPDVVGTIDDIMALMQPKPEPVWCGKDCPDPWTYGEYGWRRKVAGLDIVDYSGQGRRIKFCDLCGEKRPKGA